MITAASGVVSEDMSAVKRCQIQLRGLCRNDRSCLRRGSRCLLYAYMKQFAVNEGYLCKMRLVLTRTDSWASPGVDLSLECFFGIRSTGTHTLCQTSSRVTVMSQGSSLIRTRSFSNPQEVEGLKMPSFRKEPVKQTALQ